MAPEAHHGTGQYSVHGRFGKKSVKCRNSREQKTLLRLATPEILRKSFGESSAMFGCRLIISKIPLIRVSLAAWCPMRIRGYDLPFNRQMPLSYRHLNLVDRANSVCEMYGICKTFDIFKLFKFPHLLGQPSL